MSTSTRPGYIVDTKLGKVEATPTTANHIYVSFGSQYDKGEPLTVRGVPIRGSAHVYQYVNGEWHIGTEYSDKERTKLSTDYHKRTALHLTRIDSFTKDPSESARTALHEVLTSAIRTWVDSAEGKAALAEAASLQRTEDMKALEDEIAETEGQITKLRLKLAALKEERTK